MGSLLFLLILFGLMWWFTIRPQQQRVRAQRALVASLSVGDEVMTAGGLVGRITRMVDNELRLEVGPGVEVRVLRSSVTARVSPPAMPEGGAGGSLEP